MNTFSPSIEISKVQLPNRQADIHIIREDLLPGGTKQRAIIPFINDLILQGFTEFVYASPFCGFAQVALAIAGKHLKVKITLFSETTPNKNTFHEMSLLAQNEGAEIKACTSLGEAELLAGHHCKKNPQAFQLPLGFNHPAFLYHYTEALTVQISILKNKIDFTPKVLWVPVGSGTLIRLFRNVLPQEITLKCVDVRVLKPDDERIRAVKSIKNIQFFRSDLKFHEESEQLPPVPSNKFYDAKLWSFISANANHNDIWWNVAR